LYACLSSAVVFVMVLSFQINSAWAWMPWLRRW
jgi:hypothetical protein